MEWKAGNTTQLFKKLAGEERDYSTVNLTLDALENGRIHYLGRDNNAFGNV